MDEKIQKLIDRAQTEAKGILFLNTPSELKKFYLDGIEKYKEWRAISSIEDWLPIDKDFLQEFRMKLDAKGINTRVIFKQKGLEFEPKDVQHRKVKTISNDYTFKSNIDILDDKILIINPKLSVLGLVIEGEALVDIFIDMFDLLWSTLPESK